VGPYISIKIDEPIVLGRRPALPSLLILFSTGPVLWGSSASNCTSLCATNKSCPSSLGHYSHYSYISVLPPTSSILSPIVSSHINTTHFQTAVIRSSSQSPFFLASCVPNPTHFGPPFSSTRHTDSSLLAEDYTKNIEIDGPFKHFERLRPPCRALPAFPTLSPQPLLASFGSSRHSPSLPCQIDLISPVPDLISRHVISHISAALPTSPGLCVCSYKMHLGSRTLGDLPAMHDDLHILP